MDAGADRDLIGRPYDPDSLVIEPDPPHIAFTHPWIRCGRRLLRDPTVFLTEARAAHGDTFVVDAFGYRMLCVFSPAGVRALYALDERTASFGLATFSLLRLKVPDEVFLGRRLTPHGLFASQDVSGYLGHLERALALELDELGSEGTFETFAEAKRLAHRLGFASWIGEEATRTEYLDRLIAPFEVLDAAEAFVRPTQALRTHRTGFADERAALAAIEGILAEIWAQRIERAIERDDGLSRAVAGFSDREPADAVREAARDAIVIHLGSQSNLFAALAWTVVDLLLHPGVLARVQAGDDELLDACAYESIRMAQRSITMRYVLHELDVELDDTTYRLPAGVFLTTMLSVTNRSAAPGLDHFDPAHYERRRLTVPLPAKELVSTFGHGSHSCPAARFSLATIHLTVRTLLDRYELTPEFSSAAPRRRQIGGVARAEAPCVVRYTSR